MLLAALSVLGGWICVILVTIREAVPGTFHLKKGFSKMSPIHYPPDVLEQAIDVHEAWRQIDELLAYGPLTIAALALDIAQVRNFDHSIASLESQLTDTRNRREAMCAATWDKVKRVRAGVKATFGDDSTQYEMMGCKRLSDRKPVRRSPLPVEEA